MDVRCEKCGTEYEFEDERITEEGVTVKCSTCGHLFKIRRKSFVLTEPVVLDKKAPDDAARQWTIRKADGTLLNFKELTTLQKWIVERKVGRQDEISRTGESWKQLGSIPELASFFQIVDQAAAVRVQYASVPPAEMRPQSSGTQPMPAAIPPSVPPPAVSAPPAAAPLPAAQPTPSAPPAASEPDTWGSGPLDLSDDVVEKWRRRNRRKWLFIVPVLVLLVAVGVWYAVDQKSFLMVIHKVIGREAGIPESAQKLLDEAMPLLLQDSPGAVQAALAKLEEALQQTQGKFPRALALMALLRSGRADGSRADILELDGRVAILQQKEDALKPKDGSEPKGKLFDEIAALHNQKVELQKQRLVLVDGARKDLEEAKRLLDQALALEPANPLALVAAADHLRVLGGDRPQVEAKLAQPRAQMPGDAWLLLVEGMLLAEEPASAAEAEQKLRAALAAEPRLVRARTALVRLLAKQPERQDQALAELKLLLAQSPDHAEGQKLLAALQKPPAVPEPPPEPGKPAEAGKPTSFEEWMKLALRLQDQGQCRQALEAFDGALALKPAAVEALSGKGLCYLDMGNYNTAIGWFERALNSNPRYGEALIGLAETYKYKGDTERAKTYYQKYLDVLPGGPEAAVARRNLEELK